MAQRLIHLLFCEQVMKKIEIVNGDRFVLGNLLPDAYIGKPLRKITHYTTEVQNGKYAYFAFDKYREEFENLILKDELYLGYYMHLVVDAFYRNMIYNKLDLREKLRNYADVDVLHNDYRLLNPYIIEKYNVAREVKWPENWEAEPIHKIFPFTLECFLEDMKKDYTKCGVGSTKFVTEKVLDEFVDEYEDLCVKEIQTVKNGGVYLKPLDFKYEHKDMK